MEREYASLASRWANGHEVEVASRLLNLTHAQLIECMAVFATHPKIGPDAFYKIAATVEQVEDQRYGEEHGLTDD